MCRALHDREGGQACLEHLLYVWFAKSTLCPEMRNILQREYVVNLMALREDLQFGKHFGKADTAVDHGIYVGIEMEKSASAANRLTAQEFLQHCAGEECIGLLV